MKRICFVLQVRPECLEEYRERHRNVWPEMQQALQETGWHNYSLFLRPDGLLVGYFETEDLPRAIAEMKKRPVNDRWQTEMAPMFISDDSAKPDDQLSALEELFHLN
jgi:L-rhamnose mutarotase